MERNTFFVIATIVSRRLRHLFSAYKKIPKKRITNRSSLTLRMRKREVRTEILDSNTQIVYVCVDKSD